MRAINMPKFHIPILDGFFMISIIAAFVAILRVKRLVNVHVMATVATHKNKPERTWVKQ